MGVSAVRYLVGILCFIMCLIAGGLGSLAGHGVLSIIWGLDVSKGLTAPSLTTIQLWAFCVGTLCGMALCWVGAFFMIEIPIRIALGIPWQSNSKSGSLSWYFIGIVRLERIRRANLRKVGLINCRLEEHTE